MAIPQLVVENAGIKTLDYGPFNGKGEFIQKSCLLDSRPGELLGSLSRGLVSLEGITISDNISDGIFKTRLSSSCVVYMQVVYRRFKPAVWVIFYSAIIGSAFGYQSACWQATVEHGQVLSGLVPYESISVWSAWLQRLWSLVNQLSAAMIWAGLTEVDVSILICMLMGALSFVSLGLVILAFSNSIIFSIIGPVLIYVYELKGMGFSYPIDLMRTTQTFGIVSFSYSLLVFGCFGNRLYGSALFLLGLAPSVHVSWALLCYLAIFPVVVSSPLLRKRFWCLKWNFVVGVFLCLLSYFLQLHLGLSDVHIPSQLPTASDYQAFIDAHDVHRKRFEPFLLDVLFIIYTLTVCVVGWARNIFNGRGKYLCFAIFNSIAAGTLLFVASLMLPGFLPLQIIMASRYLNVGIAVATPIFIGIMARKASGRGVLAAFAITLLLIGSSDAMRPGVVFVYFSISLASMVFGVNCRAGCSVASSYVERALRCFSTMITTQSFAAFTLLLMMIWFHYSYYLVSSRFHTMFNDSVLARISSSGPFILTSAGLMYPQLLVRKVPILYPDCIDVVSYFPEYLYKLNVMSRDLYGIDLLEQPKDGVKISAIPVAHRTVWEGRTLEQWQSIMQKYNVSDVLVPSGWELNLQLVAKNKTYAYYKIK